MPDEKTADRPPAFKPELNIPVWLELIEHERFGFEPFEGESAAKTIVQNGKEKKIPASKYWMFHVRPVGGESTVWFCYRKETADMVVSFRSAQQQQGKVPMLAVMEFAEGTKHFLSLFAPGPGYWTVPEHATPARFLGFCETPAPVVATPVPAKPPQGEGKPTEPQTSGNAGTPKTNWASAAEAMEEALWAARAAWMAILNDAFAAQQRMEVEGDQVELTKAMDFYRVVKEAAAGGLPATAHTIFINVMGGRGR